MKKLYLITTIPETLFFFKGQIGYLKKGFDISLVSSNGKYLFDLAKIEDVKYYVVNTNREISLKQDFNSLINYIHLFHKQKPDIIHCNTPKGGLLSLLAGKMVGIKKRIYFVHGLRYQGDEGFKRKLLIFMEKLSCFCATDIIAVSNGVKTILNKEVTHKKICVIGSGSPNGIDFTRFDSSLYQKNEIRKKNNINEKDFVFGFVGRIVNDKGLAELIYAFLRILGERKDVKLLIIGKEEEGNPLDNATKVQIENNPAICFIGFQKEVRPYYVLMDALILPSYREGFGMVLLEAAALNVPSIASNIIGCNEVIIDGITGLLVKPKNRDDLYDKMMKILVDKNLYAKISINCKKEAKKRFDQTQVWENYYQKYLSIANN